MFFKRVEINNSQQSDPKLDLWIQNTIFIKNLINILPRLKNIQAPRQNDYLRPSESSFLSELFQSVKTRNQGFTQIIF